MVLILNFTGHIKEGISFSESEGIVEHIDLNVMTNKGIIGIYDVKSPRKFKPIGSVGR